MTRVHDHFSKPLCECVLLVVLQPQGIVGPPQSVALLGEGDVRPLQLLQLTLALLQPAHTHTTHTHHTAHTAPTHHSQVTQAFLTVGV